MPLLSSAMWASNCLSCVYTLKALRRTRLNRTIAREDVDRCQRLASNLRVMSSKARLDALFEQSTD